MPAAFDKGFLIIRAAAISGVRYQRIRRAVGVFGSGTARLAGGRWRINAFWLGQHRPCATDLHAGRLTRGLRSHGEHGAACLCVFSSVHPAGIDSTFIVHHTAWNCLEPICFLDGTDGNLRCGPQGQAVFFEP